MLDAAGGRSANATCAIDVIDDGGGSRPPPPVAIAPLATAKTNPSAKLALRGVVGPVATSATSATATWRLASGELADASGELAGVALSPLTVAAPANETVVTFLVLRAGALTDGAAYAFELVAAYDGDVTTRGRRGARRSTCAQRGPDERQPRDRAARGVALSTRFAFSCAGWVDDADDLPLRYAFYYSVVGDDDASGGGDADDDRAGRSRPTRADDRAAVSTSSRAVAGDALRRRDPPARRRQRERVRGVAYVID